MDSAEPLRVQFATDCPFWRNQTGAQQRILTLLEHLASKAYVVETLYCGRLSSDDKRLIARRALVVEEASVNRPPSRFLERLIWHFRGTLYWLSQKLSGLMPRQPRSGGRTLTEFRSPEIGRRFRQKLLDFKPQIVVVEYVSLAYLTEFVPDRLRQAIVLAVDTHDVMHSRCRQFLQLGHDHWIHIDERQEREALRGFDLIIAIQEEEGREFQRMLPEAKVVVVKHAVNCRDCRRDQRAKPVTIGYFASGNASNQSALRDFLDGIWPAVLRAAGESCRLLVAGSICDFFAEAELPNCTLMRLVEDVGKFYEQVEIVVNPVSFGTGLKIKNLEALAFGKCLVTSEAGLAGMPAAVGRAFFVADSANRFAELLVELIADERLRNETAAAAHELALRELNAEAVYQPLLLAFDRAVAEKLG